MNKFKAQSPKSKFGKPKNAFAKKSFGQNFLVDQTYIAKIISALNPQKDETVIEIGAGRGALTENLIESGANVVAIELERDMIAVLRERFGRAENFRLIEADALKVNFAEIINPEFKIQNPKPVKLVANLPYYISTAILQSLIEQRNVFSEMVLMFQREVVERITANTGNSERGFLTVLVEAYLQAERLFNVPPNAFLPAPKVWSSIARLKPKENVVIEDEDLFRKIISAGFRQKRKTILNNLKSEFENIEKVLSGCGIDKQQRAETLTLEDWKCLAKQKSGGEI
jgi:16S rRNA (adenine1518-N6/adenine1519-N6)-dimethyltransferase